MSDAAVQPLDPPSAAATADDTRDEPTPANELDRAISMIQDVIARLHPDRLLPANVLRQLGELRHQMATLCTLLRTRHTLAVGARAARDAELDAIIKRALDDFHPDQAAAAHEAFAEADR